MHFKFGKFSRRIIFRLTVVRLSNIQPRIFFLAFKFLPVANKFGSVKEDDEMTVKELQKIFVMPDVAKIEQNLTPIPEEFISEELT